MTTCQEVIAQHPFFRDMRPEHLQVLLECSSEIRFKPNEILFREGEPANRFYLIQSGRVAIEAHQPADGTTLVQTVGPGDVLGWSWLFPPFAWHFQARALEPTRVVALDGAHLLVTAERDHAFGHELMKRVTRVVIERLQATRKQLIEKEIKPSFKSQGSAAHGDSLEAGHAAQLVAGHPFLEGLSPGDVQLLITSASIRRFGIGQEIFHEGTEAEHFYLIHTGRVSLETFVPGQGNVVVQTIGPNEPLGWSWLFPPFRWHFTARTIEPCEVVAFGASSLREKADENREFGYDLMRRVSRVMLERLQATRRKLLEFYGVTE